MQVGLVFNNNPKILYYSTEQEFEIRSKIVVNTSRGLELATVVGYKDGKAQEELDFVRVATDEDIKTSKENESLAKSLMQVLIILTFVHQLMQ